MSNKALTNGADVTKYPEPEIGLPVPHIKYPNGEAVILPSLDGTTIYQNTGIPIPSVPQPGDVIKIGKIEADPNGKGQHEAGAKMDSGKSPVMQGALHYFPRAIKAVSDVSLVGAKKYAWKGWESVPDGVNRYGNALARHILAEETEGLIDADTDSLHAAQVAWNSLARLELILRRIELELSQKELAK